MSDSRLASDLSEDMKNDGASPDSKHVLGSALLRDYTLHLDPMNTNGASHVDEDLRDAMEKFPETSTRMNSSPQSSSPSKHSIAMAFRSDTLHAHRRGNLSTGAVPQIPQQPVLQALASKSNTSNQVPTLHKATISNRMHSSDFEERHRPSTASSQPDLTLTPRTPFTARFKYPCFFHQRFDDAVNTDRVLEEIAAEDDGYTHSRLMQTATSVREISKQLQRRPIKRAVRTILIVTKARDNSLVHLTRELTEWLLKTPRYNSDLGVTVYVDAKLRNSKRFNVVSLLAKNPRYEHMLKYWTPDLCWTCPELFDLVLTLGGDGTVLYTSWLFQRIVPSILSFSLGSLGFLTNFEFASYKTHLNRIMGDHGMRVNLRMRFTCTVFRSPTNAVPSLTNTSRTNSRTSLPSTSPASSTSALVPRNRTDSNISAHGDMVEGEQFEVLNELVID
ncbi:MAG: hypothetical protein Q9183_004369, partial [Haloplaca sp. 2 TL-2023]